VTRGFALWRDERPIGKTNEEVKEGKIALPSLREITIARYI
jgi:hypothetical protein